ncbi:GPI mannosyltransferase 2-like isoform X2 [Schistocerca gregaria]|uniref:GPI mannosyltransferase 2-like isoform X2 n=1 Tax=Schistocerca gregaria TaxID=7010 RepID=UPI00211DFD9F|nr:GPI mannosyltransferase 2-like isoform X2 [Schistocerca gregaria]
MLFFSSLRRLKPQITPYASHEFRRSMQVVGFALLTRILFTIYAMLLRLFMPLPYDTSSILAYPLEGDDYQSESTLIRPASLNYTGLKFLYYRTLRGMANWDAIFFTQIAQNGYQWENFFAFLPGYPVTIRLLSKFMIRLLGIGNTESILLSGYLASNISFVFASWILYRLSCIVLGDERWAFKSALLFCLSPATPFFLGIYSESLFAATAFTGMFFCARNRHASSEKHLFNTFMASVFFALACTVRSNAITLVGFILYEQLRYSYDRYLYQKEARTKLSRIVLEWIYAGFACFLSILPFVCYLSYGYMTYCSNPDSKRPWCQRTIPNIYSFVQDHYWNVGLFRYYTLKQVPNFLIALPVIILCIMGIVSYAICNLKQFSLGLCPDKPTKSKPIVLFPV